MVTYPKKRTLDPILDKVKNIIDRPETDERVPEQFRTVEPLTIEEKPKEKGKGTVEILKDGSEELNRIEKEKSRLMQEQGLTEKGAIEEIARAGGTERLFTPQKTVAQVQQAAAQRQGLIEPLGLSDFTTGVSPSPLPIRQGISEGLQQAALGAGAGGIIGAAFGGAGALPGAAIGAVLGFLRGTRSEIKSELKEEISVKAISLTRNQRQIGKLITAMHKDPARAPEYYSQFRQLMTRIDRSHAELQAEIKRNEKFFINEDGDKEMALFNEWYAPGGAREYFIQQAEIALLNPDPNKVLLPYPDEFETENETEDL